MSIEKGVEDLRAVLRAVGSERVALFGAEAGGTIMLLFAASYPERVTALALFAPVIYYWRTPDFPFGLTDAVGRSRRWATDSSRPSKDRRAPSIAHRRSPNMSDP
jgi:pimeloyl-ACP methyl ester carboxylesterase